MRDFYNVFIFLSKEKASKRYDNTENQCNSCCNLNNHVHDDILLIYVILLDGTNVPAVFNFYALPS